MIRAALLASAILAAWAVVARSATVAATGSASCSASSTPSFGVLPAQAGGPGQIFDAQGNQFVPRGVGVMEGQEASAQQLRSAMPGINFVRYAVYTYPTPASLKPYVDSLTAAGIVVEIENHSNGAGNAGGSQGAVFTGAALSQESSWYAAIAAAFKDNPYVWFGTNNEPSETDSSGSFDPSALSNWQMSTYQAIRGAGNNSPIMVEMNGWADPASFGAGYNPAVYAQMDNIIWDMHFYGWLTNYSTDQATNNSFLAAAVRQAQTIKSAGGVTIPVLIGEYGNSTTGGAVDSNGVQAVNAVHAAVTGGIAAGSAAWAFAPGSPGDGLLQGGGLSSYGQQVAAYVAGAGAAGSAKASCQIAQATPSIGISVDPPTQTHQQQQSATDTDATAAAAAKADQSAADADKHLQAIQNQISALQNAAMTPSLTAVGDVNAKTP